MGFPSGYTELLLPKFLLTTLSIFSLTTKLLLLLLRAVGLSDFIEPDINWSNRTEPEPVRSMSAVLIQEMLPVTRYREPDHGEPEERCTVCLYDFKEEEEIRRLRNCPHMFHRSCVDRWIDHDRKTCPLCRTCLVPDELKDGFNDKLWAASAIPEFYSEYSSITNF